MPPEQQAARITKVSGLVIRGILGLILVGVVLFLFRLLAQDAVRQEATPVPFSEQPGYVSRTTIEPWPLSVDEGVVSCVMPGEAVLFTVPNGTIYAVNSPARERPNRPANWRDIMEITVGKDVYALIDEGLALCK